MWPLLLLIAAAGAVALGGGTGNAPKAGGPLLKLRVKAPSKVRLGRLKALAVSKPPAKGPPPPPKLPTAQQLLEEIEAQARIAVAKALGDRPALNGEPSAIADWAKRHNLSGEELVSATRGLGWWKNHGSHKETVWRAEYNIASHNSVQWWVNTDGSYGYHHVWGETLGDFIGDLESTVSNAASWLSHQLSRINWDAIANDIEFVASFVPVIGTAVSDIVATIQVAIDDLTSNLSGLGKALMAGYEYALSSVPGGAALKNILDGPVKILLEVFTGPYAQDVFDIATGKKKPTEVLLQEMAAAMPDVFPKGELVDFVEGKENVGKLIIGGIANMVPNTPNIEGINPRSIVASLISAAAHAMGVKT